MATPQVSKMPTYTSLDSDKPTSLEQFLQLLTTLKSSSISTGSAESLICSLINLNNKQASSLDHSLNHELIEPTSPHGLDQYKGNEVILETQHGARQPRHQYGARQPGH